MSKLRIIIFITSSLLIFSGGYFLGQYRSHYNANNTLPETAKKKDEVLSDIVLSTPPLCIDENNTKDKFKSASLTILESSEQQENITVETLPPLSEDELLQNINLLSTEITETEEQYRNADIQLLESTLTDMLDKGEPLELIEELRKDLDQLQQSTLSSTDYNGTYPSEMSAQEHREEMIQSLSSEGILTEENEQIVHDIFPDNDGSDIPIEVDGLLPISPPAPVE